MAIPINTDNILLMLCLTTSVSFEAFILGYFKLISNPITALSITDEKLVISSENIDNILG